MDRSRVRVTYPAVLDLVNVPCVRPSLARAWPSLPRLLSRPAQTITKYETFPPRLIYAGERRGGRHEERRARGTKGRRRLPQKSSRDDDFQEERAQRMNPSIERDAAFNFESLRRRRRRPSSFEFQLFSDFAAVQASKCVRMREGGEAQPRPGCAVSGRARRQDHGAQNDTATRVVQSHNLTRGQLPLCHWLLEVSGTDQYSLRTASENKSDPSDCFS